MSIISTTYICSSVQGKGVSDIAATVIAMARFPSHHALKYRTSLATHLATVVATNSHTTEDCSALFDVCIKHG